LCYVFGDTVQQEYIEMTPEGYCLEIERDISFVSLHQLVAYYAEPRAKLRCPLRIHNTDLLLAGRAASLAEHLTLDSQRRASLRLLQRPEVFENSDDLFYVQRSSGEIVPMRSERTLTLRRSSQPSTMRSAQSVDTSSYPRSERASTDNGERVVRRHHHHHRRSHHHHQDEEDDGEVRRYRRRGGGEREYRVVRRRIIREEPISWSERKSRRSSEKSHSSGKRSTSHSQRTSQAQLRLREESAAVNQRRYTEEEVRDMLELNEEQPSWLHLQMPKDLALVGVVGEGGGGGVGAGGV
jgi:hypothetical protein